MTAFDGGTDRRDLVGRALLCAGLLALLVYSVRSSFALSIGQRDPAAAYRIAPWNARISAAYAGSLLVPDVKPEQVKRAAAIARGALVRDPTNASAAATIATATAYTNDVPRARSQFLYSERLSRRLLAAQLWLIEDSVTRGDVPGALKHYDTALRASSSAGRLLYPILAKAISDPNVRQSVGEVLSAKPLWGPEFLTEIGLRGPDFVAASDLFVLLRKRKVAIEPALENQMMAKLVDAGQHERAWQYYLSVNPRDRGSLIRNGDFRTISATPAPFDWLATTEGGATAIAEWENGRTFLHFQTVAGEGGALVRQLMLLNAGRYVLTGRVRSLPAAANERPYWRVVCLSSIQIARIPLPEATDSGTLFSAEFTVPNDCKAQYLVLTADPTDGVDGISGELEAVRLRRAG